MFIRIKSVRTSTRIGSSSREGSIQTLLSCFLETRLAPCVLQQGRAIKGDSNGEGQLAADGRDRHIPCWAYGPRSRRRFACVSLKNHGIRHIAKAHPKNTLLPTQQHLSEVILRLTLKSPIISRRCLGLGLRSCRCSTSSGRWVSCPTQSCSRS